MSADTLEFNRHPIQLVSVGVKELSFRADRPPILIKAAEIGQATINVGHNEYEVGSRIIKVFMKVESTGEDDVYFLAAEIVGEFRIGEEFEEAKVEVWAEKAAPLVLYPFLREHVYSLCIRAQLRPLLLPLVQVPTFNFAKKSSPKSLR